MKDFHFQSEVNTRFSEGQNIVLQAPTGAGKTRAALLPGIRGFEAQYNNSHHYIESPSRIVYGVPMRVLARSFFDEFSKTARQKDWEKDWYPRVQMGEQADDPLFEGRLIFATVDQMLASFLHMPYGIPRRLDNINAGAFIGSYLIFDEFHLYPGHEMMLTVLAMLKMLAKVSRFTMMSATFSKPFLVAIADELGAHIIADEPGTPLMEGKFHDVLSLQSQQRRWYAHEGVLNSDAIQQHRGQRTLAICNTVERAQALYAAARDLLPDVECRLLHSRFYREDRRKIEDWALANYAKPESMTPEQQALRTAKPCLLIATQVIEVGLDISSDAMLTECAPAASLIQRAGRCARRENENGQVHVYQPFDAEGQVNYSPYGSSKKQAEDDAGLESVCRKTWETLTSSNFNQQVLSFAEEQAWINAAHDDHDKRFIDGLSAKLEARIDEITKCIQDRNAGRLGELIRKQTTVPLYIRADLRDEKLTEHPRQLESLSLSRGQIKHAWDAAVATAPDADFLFAGCTGASDAAPDADGMTQDVFKWHLLHENKEIYQGGYAWFVAHPNAIAYDESFGLRLMPTECPAPESPDVPGSSHEREPFMADRYHEHITGLYLAYTHSFELKHMHSIKDGYQFKRGDKLYMPLRDEIAYGLRRLCERIGKGAERVERLIRLMLALHDVGKLNQPWQDWARAWQQHRLDNGFEIKLVPHEGPFAHTDLDGRNEVEAALSKAFKHAPRGNHAVESAEACLPLLWEACNKDKFLFDVVLSSIMHHHTPTASECGQFDMVAEGSEAIMSALEACGFAGEADQWANQIRRQFLQNGKRIQEAAQEIQPTPRAYEKNLMYALFVRVLRLADQRSGDYWRKYGEPAVRY
jgi:CRISPR-associated endonuclease/helicase Cas3